MADTKVAGAANVSISRNGFTALSRMSANEFGGAYKAAKEAGYTDQAAENIAQQVAAANVDTALNRAAALGLSVEAVVNQPNQFSGIDHDYHGWENAPDASKFQQQLVASRLGEVYNGVPTRDFTHFGNLATIVEKNKKEDTLNRSFKGETDPDKMQIGITSRALNDRNPLGLISYSNPYAKVQHTYYGPVGYDVPQTIGLSFDPNIADTIHGLEKDWHSSVFENQRNQALETYSRQNPSVPDFGMAETDYGQQGYSPPSFGMNETNYGGYSPPSFGMNETDYGASDPYGGWSNPAEGTRSYGPSYDGGYTTGGMFGGDSFATGGQFGTPAGGYGFGQGYGESYAGNTSYGYDTPSESRAAPAEQTGSAFGGYAGYSPSQSAFGMNETDYGRSTPSYGMAETDYGQSYGQPSYGHNETDYGQTANPDATSEPAAARSVTMAPSMTATTVPGAYSPTGVTPATFGAVPSMVGMPSPDFGAATTADEAFGSVPSMVGTSFPSMAETTQPKARARARAAIDEPTYSIPTPRATYTPSYSDYMGGFVGPSGTIDQSTAMFGGIGNPLGSVIGPSPSYSGGFMGPSGAIDQSTAMFGGVGAPLGTAMDPSTPASSFGFGMPSFSGFGGWGEPGSVADTGTFGGMYGPGQIGNRGDWSGDVNTSGPGLGGALSDAFGSTNWAGSWNGVDQTGRNLGWGAAYGITPRDELGLSYGLAARGYGMGGGFGGFVGPGGQSISAATAMFGGVGAPLGSASYGFGSGGSDGGGMGGGYGGNNGGGYGGNGHSSMGDASY